MTDPDAAARPFRKRPVMSMTRVQSTAVISAFLAIAGRSYISRAAASIDRPSILRAAMSGVFARSFPPSLPMLCDGSPGAMMRLLASVVVVSVAVGGGSPALAQGGWIDEGKLGLIAHDINLGGKHKEPGGDINGELLFTSPGFLSVIGAPRPHLGVSVNDAGATSYAYAGLTWTAEWRDILFGGLGLGGAVHNGNLDAEEPHHKALGSRALFHESLEFGVRLTQRVSTSLFLDHISNADLARHNPGITNFGLRAGFKF